jgi:hypothetical protein
MAEQLIDVINCCCRQPLSGSGGSRARKRRAESGGRATMMSPRYICNASAQQKPSQTHLCQLLVAESAHVVCVGSAGYRSARAVVSERRMVIRQKRPLLISRRDAQDRSCTPASASRVCAGTFLLSTPCYCCTRGLAERACRRPTKGGMRATATFCGGPAKTCSRHREERRGGGGGCTLTGYPGSLEMSSIFTALW